MNTSDPKVRGGESWSTARLGPVLDEYLHHVDGDGAGIVEMASSLNALKGLCSGVRENERVALVPRLAIICQKPDALAVNSTSPPSSLLDLRWLCEYL